MTTMLIAPDEEQKTADEPVQVAETKTTLAELLATAISVQNPAPDLFKKALYGEEIPPYTQQVNSEPVVRYDPPKVFRTTPWETKPDATVLREARLYMESHGWTRGYLIHRPSGAVCAAGAIAASQGWITADSQRIPDEHIPQMMRLAARVVEATRWGWYSSNPNTVAVLAQWNDSVAQGEDHVRNAFFQAERRACGEGGPPREPDFRFESKPAPAAIFF